MNFMLEFVPPCFNFIDLWKSCRLNARPVKQFIKVVCKCIPDGDLDVQYIFTRLEPFTVITKIRHEKLQMCDHHVDKRKLLDEKSQCRNSSPVPVNKNIFRYCCASYMTLSVCSRFMSLNPLWYFLSLFYIKLYGNRYIWL